VEEFSAVVGRFGGWKSDVAEFLAAAKGQPRQPESADVF
jgi:hypothetical protein